MNRNVNIVSARNFGPSDKPWKVKVPKKKSKPRYTGFFAFTDEEKLKLGLDEKWKRFKRQK